MGSCILPKTDLTHNKHTAIKMKQGAEMTKKDSTFFSIFSRSFFTPSGKLFQKEKGWENHGLSVISQVRDSPNILLSDV